MQRAVLPSLALCAAALLCATPAWALYKVLGPDGRVTYTDRPPFDAPAQTLKSNGSAVASDGLPYELQRVVSRYPVTLYTGQACSPCDNGRQLLKTRGVPFIEKTVTTPDDVKAFTRAEGTDQLPVVHIGQKQLQGFSQSEWTSYLDAAGYPAKSALPLNYRWPAASPLVAVEPKGSATSDTTRESAPRVPPATPNTDAPSGSTPPGFRF